MMAAPWSRTSKGAGIVIRSRGDLRARSNAACSGDRLFQRRKKYRRLETIAARAAGPIMAHTAVVDMFRPIRREQPSVTLRTGIFIVRARTRGTIDLLDHEFPPVSPLPADWGRLSLWRA